MKAQDSAGQHFIIDIKFQTRPTDKMSDDLSAIQQTKIIPD
jgi:hypothetical protein